MIILKVTKNVGIYPLSRKYIFGKTTLFRVKKPIDIRKNLYLSKTFERSWDAEVCSMQYLSINRFF